MKSIMRLALLISFAALGLFLLFNTESYNGPLVLYCLLVMADKTVGALLIAAACRFYCRWRKTDPLLRAHEKWCREADSARL